MNRLLAMFRLSVGRKVLMAVTGVLLLGFLIVHLVGNLYVLQGQEALNTYAAWLKENPLLWPARIGLILVCVLHVWLGISLARRNRAARTLGYRGGPSESRLSSRSMALTGLVILAFVVYHLLHFTFGYVLPEAHARVDAKGRHDVYSMVVTGFRNPWIVASYVVAMALLGVHLAHASQSLLQTLGIRYEHGNRLLRNFTLTVVAVITVGNLALPLFVFLGLAGPADVGPSVSRADGGALP